MSGLGNSTRMSVLGTSTRMSGLGASTRERARRRGSGGGQGGGILDNLLGPAGNLKDGQRSSLRNNMAGLAGLGAAEDLYPYPTNINRGAAGATFTGAAGTTHPIPINHLLYPPFDPATF